MYPRPRLPRIADQVPSQSLRVLQRIRKAYLCNFTHGDLPNNQWITPQGDHTLQNVHTTGLPTKVAAGARTSYSARSHTAPPPSGACTHRSIRDCNEAPSLSCESR